LLGAADKRVDRAKQGGRGCVTGAMPDE